MKNCHFLQLPTSVLRRILLYFNRAELGKLRLVCPLICEATTCRLQIIQVDEVNRHKRSDLTLSAAISIIITSTTKSPSSIITQCPVPQFSFHNFHSDSSNIAPQLGCLGCKVVEDILEHCRSLVKLIIPQTTFAISWLTRLPKTLEDLHVYNLIGYDHDGSTYLLCFQRLRTLRSLRFQVLDLMLLALNQSEIRGIKQLSIKYTRSPDIPSFYNDGFANLSYIQDITLCDCRGMSTLKGLQSLSNLHQLSFIRYIFPNQNLGLPFSNSIQKLVLDECENSHRFLSCVVENLNDLHSITLRGLRTDACLHQLIRLPKTAPLTHLAILDSPKIMAETVISWLLAYSYQLITLDLSCTTSRKSRFDTKLDFSGLLKQFLRNSPRLTNLGLDGCSEVDKSILECILAHCDSLTGLSIRGCNCDMWDMLLFCHARAQVRKRKQSVSLIHIYFHDYLVEEDLLTDANITIHTSTVCVAKPSNGDDAGSPPRTPNSGTGSRIQDFRRRFSRST